MSKFTLRVALDPEDLAAIKQITDPTIRLWPAMRVAMSESLDAIEYEAQDWMDSNFENSTGQLAGAFEKYVGTFESELENDLPYAQRRNYGFSGQTDSLGRFYPLDGGIAWAEKGIANAFDDVELIWQVAIDHALGRGTI